MTVDATIPQQISEYALLPLWPVVGGRCSCPQGEQCHSPGKHPHSLLAPRGVHSASRDKDTQHRWAQHSPGWAVATGHGLVVIDCDAPGASVEDVLQILGLDHDQITFTVRTQSGGLHLYWYTTRSIRCRVRAWPSIDVRAEGGYVCCPPTLGVSGAYRVEVDAPIAPLPDSLLHNLLDPPPAPPPLPPRYCDQSEQRYIDAAVRSICEEIASTPPGRRNVCTFYLGLRAVRLAGPSVVDQICSAARQSGLPHRECRTLVRQILRYATLLGPLSVPQMSAASSSSHRSHSMRPTSTSPPSTLVCTTAVCADALAQTETVYTTHSKKIVTVVDDTPRRLTKTQLMQHVITSLPSLQGHPDLRSTVTALHEGAESHRLPLLRGIRGTPVISATGAVQRQSGYDPHTGWYCGRHAYPVLVETLDQDTARARLLRLARLIPVECEQPTSSAWLAAILTACTRHCTPPLIQIHGDPLASETVARCIAYLASGQEIAPVPLSGKYLSDLSLISRLAAKASLAVITHCYRPQLRLLSTAVRCGAIQTESGAPRRHDLLPLAVCATVPLEAADALTLHAHSLRSDARECLDILHSRRDQIVSAVLSAWSTYLQAVGGVESAGTWWETIPQCLAWYGIQLSV